jgi:hypothetical protein
MTQGERFKLVESDKWFSGEPFMSQGGRGAVFIVRGIARIGIVNYWGKREGSIETEWTPDQAPTSEFKPEQHPFLAHTRYILEGTSVGLIFTFYKRKPRIRLWVPYGAKVEKQKLMQSPQNPS